MAARQTRLPVRLDLQIFVVRGERVMLDRQLSDAYGVTTKALNQAVKRNAGRFPRDFAFQLNSEDMDALRSQIVTANSGRGGRRSRPWAFTEHGAIMAAAVLNSRRAVEMSVFVVRAFMRLRNVAHTHAMIAAKLGAIERSVGRHDAELKSVFRALRTLLMPAARRRRAIGFRA